MTDITIEAGMAEIARQIEALMRAPADIGERMDAALEALWAAELQPKAGRPTERKRAA